MQARRGSRNSVTRRFLRAAALGESASAELLVELKEPRISGNRGARNVCEFAAIQILRKCVLWAQVSIKKPDSEFIYNDHLRLKDVRRFITICTSSRRDLKLSGFQLAGRACTLSFLLFYSFLRLESGPLIRVECTRACS